MSNKKELLGGLALGALGVATGGFGLLAAPELAAGGLAAGAAGAGAADAAATGAIGAGALGMATPAAGAAAAFGPEAGSVGAGLLGSGGVTPAMTSGLGLLDAGGAAGGAFGAAPGAVNALGYDPAQLSSPLSRLSAFMQGDKGSKIGNAMGKMAIQNAMGSQQQPQHMQATPPMPMQQPQQMAEDYRRRGQVPPFMAGSFV